MFASPHMICCQLWMVEEEFVLLSIVNYTRAHAGQLGHQISHTLKKHDCVGNIFF